MQGNGLQQRQQWTANGYLHTQSLTRPRSNDYLRKRQHHYDPAGQLTTIDDSNRGTLSYRYDPLNRLLGAHSRLGAETFAFDPASNLLDPHEAPQANGLKRSRQMDNLLHQYLGNHYRYDPRGNLSERWLDGQHGRFTWDLYDRLVGYEDARLKVNYGYDALGRRLYKQSAAKYQDRAQAGPLWNRKQRLDLDERYGCKSSIYGWDGDNLAFESTYHPRGERTTHYLYEPGTFVPLVQASYEQQIALLPEPSYDGPYDIDQDPVWQYQPQAPAFKALDWYQCDHLGTPLELTDQHGEMVWRADYHAWGQAQVRLSEAAQRRKLDTALRFQGQYLDVETGLHYNRYRYYDPQVGRFVSADPIGYAGGLNLYQYAPNPVEWVDPLGLASNRDFRPTAILERKLSVLENAQNTSARERILPDGRIRYYGREALAKNPGPTRGRSRTTEYNPTTGQVRVWEETYDHSGKINRVHPKMNNGESISLPHYPPTKADIEQGLATPEGRAIKCGCTR
ncbi:RHS repeat-associated core domain-containing protein [Pseudomonas urmiensis]|uniref:RHS repeat-associated core domain-containing protein n=1 Tax=Pseudomonas urmiensis TaxID=2745493 RepID=UPI003C98D667